MANTCAIDEFDSDAQIYIKCQSYKNNEIMAAEVRLTFDLSKLVPNTKKIIYNNIARGYGTNTTRGIVNSLCNAIRFQFGLPKQDTLDKHGWMVIYNPTEYESKVIATQCLLFNVSNEFRICKEAPYIVVEGTSDPKVSETLNKTFSKLLANRNKDYLLNKDRMLYVIERGGVINYHKHYENTKNG